MSPLGTRGAGTASKCVIAAYCYESAVDRPRMQHFDRPAVMGQPPKCPAPEEVKHYAWFDVLIRTRQSASANQLWGPRSPVEQTSRDRLSVAGRGCARPAKRLAKSWHREVMEGGESDDTVEAPASRHTAFLDCVVAGVSSMMCAVVDGSFHPARDAE